MIKNLTEKSLRHSKHAYLKSDSFHDNEEIAALKIMKIKNVSSENNLK